MWRPLSTASAAVSKRSNRQPTYRPATDAPQPENTSNSAGRDGSGGRCKDVSVARRPGVLTRQQSALSEALRGNPFCNDNDSRDNVSTKPNSSMSAPRNASPREPKPDPVESLNKDLRYFARIYPDVQVEVLRELLTRFDGGDSRLHISVEQLFRYKHEWARGRLLNPPRDADDKIPRADMFRREDYKIACRSVLYAEFKSPLSKSTVDAVLAEVNYGYRKARPILQDLAAKTWRVTITNFLFSRRKKSMEETPPVLVEKMRDGSKQLRLSGDFELDAELEDLFIAPARERLDVVRRQGDMQLARDLNQQEAEEANALFECQCCYDEVPFEQITTCTLEGHFICVDCVRRTLSEALFGQGWAKAVDGSRGTLNCIAPTPTGECQGHVQHRLLRDVITSQPSGHETWRKFEQRLTTDNLSKANLQLTSCPFCFYAEVAETPAFDRSSSASTSNTNQLKWHFHLPRSSHISLNTILLFILIESLLPTVLVIIFIFYVFDPTLPKRSFQTSLLKLHAAQRTSLFKCKNTSCLKKSCLKCHKHWRDPHTCHEPLILSLRTTVEAARTAALKRTCPRCGTSFVKSSGCNKLVCVCGYAMCYICRKNIGKVNSSNNNNNNQQPNVRAAARQDNPNFNLNFNLNFVPNFGLNVNANANNNLNRAGQDQNQNQDQDQDLIAAGEGYRHFCPHFRPIPGQKCTECDKCDLYKNEDEDALVRRAGEEAERKWRQKYLDIDLDSPLSVSNPEHKTGREGDGNGNDEGNADTTEKTAKPRSKADLQRLEDALAGIGERDSRSRRIGSASSDGASFSASVLDVWKGWKSGRLNMQTLVDFVVERCIVVEDERAVSNREGSGGAVIGKEGKKSEMK